MQKSLYPIDNASSAVSQIEGDQTRQTEHSKKSINLLGYKSPHAQFSNSAFSLMGEKRISKSPGLVVSDAS